MKLIAALGAVVMFLIFLVGAAPEQTDGAFSSLKVGQGVSLKDNGDSFSVMFLQENVPQTHVILELGSDFVVVEDIAKVSQTTIPVYSLKSIVNVRTKN